MSRRIYVIDTILWKERKVRYVLLYLELHNAWKKEELQGLSCYARTRREFDRLASHYGSWRFWLARAWRLEAKTNVMYVCMVYIDGWKRDSVSGV